MSVWLWLSVIGSVIYLLQLLLDLSKISFAELGSLSTADLIQYVSPYIYALVVFVGYIELLCWKIGGYGRVLSITIVYVLVNLLWAYSAKLELEGIGVAASVDCFSIVVAPLVSMLMLFLILRIKKDGVSYLDAMAYSSVRSLMKRQTSVQDPDCPPKSPEEKRSEPEFKHEEKNNRVWGWLVFLLFIIVGFAAHLLKGGPDDAGQQDNRLEDKMAEEIVETNTAGVHYGHEWVDLGLSSGLLWAKCNIGASSPASLGDHFAWGEVKSKESGNSDVKLDGFIINGWYDIGGSRAYDAARVNWSGYWRMPTYDEFEELIKECSWRWTSENGVEGYEVTGPNGNSVFLPAAHDGTGYYWCSMSDMITAFNAYYLAFYSESMEMSTWGSRCDGHSIRPVYSKNTVGEDPVPVSDTFYTKGVLSVNGIIYPLVYVDGDEGGYYIGKYEVTQELWKAVMGTSIIDQRNKANPKWSLRGVGDDLPMYYVSYYEAVEFCQRLKELTGRNFHLPTESQWECAALGKEDTYSSYSIDAMAWYKDNSGETTHKVGTKAPNDIGIHDMCGNVREWCDGWYGEDRVLRGGGWYNDEASNSVTARYGDRPEARDNNYGFRLCL